jgi:hypothetical protein
MSSRRVFGGVWPLPYGTLLRYADQVLTTMVFLTINLASPYLFSEQMASRLLYESSWALLGAVIATAGFGTQFLARAGQRDRGDARNVLAAYGLTGIAVAALFLISQAADICAPGHLAGLVAFGYVWGACDLVRRIALSANRVALSAALSAASFVSVAGALGLASRVGHAELVWGASFTGVGLAICVALFVLWRYGLLQRDSDASLPRYLYATSRGSLTTLASYGLAWLATQGLFVLWYRKMSAAMFIETKWAFTLLGVFGVALAVQQNRYQPAISSAIFQTNRNRTTDLLVELRRENAFIGIFAVVVIAVAVYLRPEIGLLTCALLLIYRQCFALSMTNVYVLRARGRFDSIMFSNAVACLVSYVSAYAAINFGLNAIAWGLATYGIGMYLMTICNAEGRRFSP